MFLVITPKTSFLFLKNLLAFIFNVGVLEMEAPFQRQDISLLIFSMLFSIFTIIALLEAGFLIECAPKF